jgi:hypothetical protein
MPSWFDRFGQEWASVGLTDDPTNAQADAGWAFIGQAPPTVEQFNSMFQWSDDKDNWLYGQIANVITSENMLPDPTDLTQLLRAITAKFKIRLYAGYTVWVDPINGSDANMGLQSAPFRTIQAAITWIFENIEPAFQWVTIQLMPGEYAPFSVQTTWNGAILIQGDAVNPRSYLIKNTNGYAIQAAYAAWFALQGVSVEASGGDTDYDTYGCGLAGVNTGVIIYRDIAFGVCSNAHIAAWNAGQVWSWDITKYTVYAGARCHYSASTAAICTAVKTAITIQNNPMFSLGWAVASVGGYIQTWGMTFTGTARGRKAYLDVYGVTNTGGINPDSHYPGDVASYISRGGMYV